ncbi:hypothetical protein JG688_00018224 [Phytophthora aleatoria]|uniref:Uncharacterized protein n=1 Tax=Phytophthora aleatoria TaxID=2496075 RepID=A0A8J5LUV8_9STRA|nr:hypothetical protein JG688_00018224 [Phytophthora aleatoria]
MEVQDLTAGTKDNESRDAAVSKRKLRSLCNRRERVDSTFLIGASKIEQLEETLKSLELVDKITPEIRAKIDTIAGFKPAMPTCPTARAPAPPKMALNEWLSSLC